MNTLRHLFTGKDNLTPDIGRILWALGVVAYIVYAGWDVIHSGHWDAMSYGTGLGLALAGGGLGIGAKAKTEPGAD